VRRDFADFNAQMHTIYQQNAAPIPGAEETFAFLRSRGIKIATDTGFDTDLGSVIMQRLNWPGRLIDLAVYSSDVRQGRPAPYMIFHAMEQLCVLGMLLVVRRRQGSTEEGPTLVATK
jgi:beta-phosphoglucomutase-like phosphatase (HAD superfamily)